MAYHVSNNKKKQHPLITAHETPMKLKHVDSFLEYLALP